jgi:hypothetical protein
MLFDGLVATTITTTLPQNQQQQQQQQDNNIIIMNNSKNKNDNTNKTTDPSSEEQEEEILHHDHDDLEAQQQEKQQAQAQAQAQPQPQPQQRPYHNPNIHSTAAEFATIESTIQSCFVVVDDDDTHAAVETAGETTTSTTTLQQKMKSNSNKKQQLLKKKGNASRSRSQDSFDGDGDDHDGGSVDSDDTIRSSLGSSSTSWKGKSAFPLWVTVSLIIFLGAATCAAFVGIGVSSAQQDQTDQFERLAEDLVTQIQRAWQDYVTAAAWIHGRCRTRNFTRADFRQTYEYLVGSGLDFQAAQFDPNITREGRAGAETEARDFYAKHYPHIEYRGIIGFETANSTKPVPRSEQDYYFPIHVSLCSCL